MPFAVGQNVGPYRILEQLGQGGMATVYKAYHAALDRYVALKVLHPAFREDATFVSRFGREARVVAKLEHAHIVPIYDFSESEGQPYLVMKYIEGETLKARLNRGPLSAEDAVRIIGAIGSALSYAHSKGILHRDIKPSNILLTPDGGIFLADFGLARIAQSGESTISSDMLLGTPHYISPEQAQGLKDLNEGTDIYSLGVVLYEISVGRVPFNADTPFSIIHDHIFTPLPLPRIINPKVPDAVERVLLKALAKDRKDRYANVDAMTTAFISAVQDVTGKKVETQKLPLPGMAEQIRRSAPPSGPAAGAADRKPPFWARVPWWVWAILGAVVVCPCSCYLGLAGLGAISERVDSRNTQTAQVAERTSAPSDGGMPSFQPTTEVAVFTPEFEIPEDAREGWAQLEKGLAMLDSGDKEAAAGPLQVALDKIPAERSSVLRMAVEKLIARGDWMTAAAFCNRSFGSGKFDSALKPLSAQVFFHVANLEDGEDLLLDYMVNLSDWSVPTALYAYWLAGYTDDLESAETYLRTAKSIAVAADKPLVQVVSGDLLCWKGDTQNGIDTLKRVLEDPNTPPWLRVETERLIKEWSQ